MDITENRGPAQLPILSGSQLLSTPLGTVRKGGLDPDDVSALLGRAAAAIDELYAQLEAANANSAGAVPVPDDAAVASTILTSAQRVADEVLADANTRAAELIAAAERSHTDAVSTAAELVANARADAEASVADLAGEISALQVRRAEEAAQLDAQLDAFRTAAAQVHARATASLEAAVAQLDSYVAGDTPLPDVADVADVGTASGDADLSASIWADDVAAEPVTGEGPEALDVVVVEAPAADDADVVPPAPPAFTGDPLPDPWELLAADAEPVPSSWAPTPIDSDADESDAAEPTTWPVVPEPGIGEHS